MKKRLLIRNSMIRANKDNVVTLQTREEEFAHSVNSVLQELNRVLRNIFQKLMQTILQIRLMISFFDRTFIYKFSMKEEQDEDV